MTGRKIPAGAQCLRFSGACKKLARGETWLWDRLKKDPQFPKPIYIGSRAVFIESELDNWLQQQADLSATRTGQAEESRMKVMAQASVVSPKRKRRKGMSHDPV